MPRKFLLPKYTEGHYNEHGINTRLEAQKPKQWTFFKTWDSKLQPGYKRLKDVFGRGRYFGAGSSVAPTIAPESQAVNYGCKYF